MTLGLVLYAPNVHTGGGFVLLRALLSAWQGLVPLTAILDARARARLPLPQGTNVSWVAATVSSRLSAELGLRQAAGSGDTVLCFHGLPPLLPNAARIVVFLQNRLLLGEDALSHYSWNTRLRLTYERFVSRAFRHRASEYVVQTPAMQRAVIKWYGSDGQNRKPKVKVLPFFEMQPASVTLASVPPRWDFVYVADGEAHKNHRALLAAWQLLAQDGLRPSLALTLSPRDDALRDEVEAACAQTALRIRNLGQITREEVIALYSNARAMIFPSTSESFGMPLVEAAHV